MKFISSIGLLLILAGCGNKQGPGKVNPSGHAEHGHRHDAPGTGSQVLVSTAPERAVPGTTVALNLMIHDADGAMVRQFEIVHEKFAHLAIVSEDLRHFAHLHPAVGSDGRLSTEYVFPAGGKYRLFVDFATQEHGPQTAKGEMIVDGESTPIVDLTPDAPGVITADGVSVDVSAEPLISGRATRVRLTARKASGDSAALEPLMGETGHLMLIGADHLTYIHAHPASGNAAEGWVEFESVLEEPGLYKAWGQIRHDGRVRVIPFVVRVK